MHNSPTKPLLRSAVSRRDTLRVLLGGGVALIAAPTLLGACGTSTGTKAKLAGSSGAGAGTKADIPLLRWGNGSFQGLDAASAASNFGSTATAPALETLIGFTSDLKITPILAESYAKPDALHYVYKIRSRVKFWDGSPMTAADVSYSMNRHINPKVASELATYFTNVKSIDVTGPSEVTVTLSAPNPEFEYVPALVDIFPQSFVESRGSKFGTPGGSTINVMGTGPMQITNYDDTGVTYEAFDGYWGVKSLVKKLELLTFSSADSARLAYQAGAIDGTFFGVSGDTISQWDSVPDARLQSSQPMNLSYLALNTTLAPFDDIHARRALAYATDTAGFLKAFLRQAGEVPQSIVPPAYFANLADQATIDSIYAQIPQYPFDLDKAKAELAQSKYPHGFTVKVPYTTQIEGIVEEVLVSMSTTLKQIGINFQPESMPIGSWADVHQQNNSPILWGYWLPDYPDPADIEALFFPSAGAVPHRNNAAHWKVPAVDALLAQQADSLSNSTRLQDLGKMLVLAGEQLPYLPLWWERAVMAVNNRKFVYDGFSPMYYVNNWVPDVRAAAA